MDLGLGGKRALVLGASRGLGAAIARGLAAEGAEVWAGARSHDRIMAYAAEATGTIHAEALDVSDLTALDALADRLLIDGGVDILVNNTGGPPPATATQTTRDQWIGQFEAMAANVIHLTHKLVPAMQTRGWGRIITVTSSGIEQPIPNLALSNGIRSALLGWSKSLSLEVAKDGVTANIVMPGRIHTQRIDELDGAAAEKLGISREEAAKRSAAAIPAGRYGRPEEFADLAVFLASERAAYITGSKFRVDGGLVAGV